MPSIYENLVDIMKNDLSPSSLYLELRKTVNLNLDNKFDLDYLVEFSKIIYNQWLFKANSLFVNKLKPEIAKKYFSFKIEFESVFNNFKLTEAAINTIRQELIVIKDLSQADTENESNEKKIVQLMLRQTNNNPSSEMIRENSDSIKRIFDEINDYDFSRLEQASKIIRNEFTKNYIDTPKHFIFDLDLLTDSQSSQLMYPDKFIPLIRAIQAKKSTVHIVGNEKQVKIYQKSIVRHRLKTDKSTEIASSLDKTSIASGDSVYVLKAKSTELS